MALFWPEAHLAIILDKSEPNEEHACYPDDVLMLRVSPEQLESEEFVDRIRQLILSRAHYLTGLGEPPESLGEPSERALIRLIVRGEGHVVID